MAAQVSVLHQSSSFKRGVVAPSCGTLHLTELLLQCWTLAVLGALPSLAGFTEHPAIYWVEALAPSFPGIWNLD